MQNKLVINIPETCEDCVICNIKYFTMRYCSILEEQTNIKTFNNKKDCPLNQLKSFFKGN